MAIPEPRHLPPRKRKAPEKFDHINIRKNGVYKPPQQPTNDSEEEDLAMPKPTTKSIVDNSPYGPAKLWIYFWQSPRPVDFLNLSDTRRAWKTQTDAEEAASDVDEGLEEWDAIADTADILKTIDELRGLIARTCVIRAKRAFRAGKTWKSYAQVEIRAESEIDDLRLPIFEAISPRLCNEIWLEAYPGLQEELEARRDSKLVEEEVRDAGKDLAGTGCTFGEYEVPRPAQGL